MSYLCLGMIHYKKEYKEQTGLTLAFQGIDPAHDATTEIQIVAPFNPVLPVISQLC
jgi:hypothetical protein